MDAYFPARKSAVQLKQSNGKVASSIHRKPQHRGSPSYRYAPYTVPTVVSMLTEKLQNSLDSQMDANESEIGSVSERNSVVELVDSSSSPPTSLPQAGSTASRLSTSKSITEGRNEKFPSTLGIAPKIPSIPNVVSNPRKRKDILNLKNPSNPIVYSSAPSKSRKPPISIDGTAPDLYALWLVRTQSISHLVRVVINQVAEEVDHLGRICADSRPNSIVKPPRPSKSQRLYHLPLPILLDPPPLSQSFRCR
jgi:hypothetical protein